MTPGTIPQNALYKIMQLLNQTNTPGLDVVQQVEILIADNQRMEAKLHREQTRDTRTHLLELLDEDRSEILSLLADDALDRGRDGEAMGFRWLANRLKWPTKTAKGWRWQQGPSSHELPLGLYLACPGPFQTQGKAILAVVNAIATGQWKPGKG